MSGKKKKGGLRRDRSHYSPVHEDHKMYCTRHFIRGLSNGHAKDKFSNVLRCEFKVLI